MIKAVVFDLDNVLYSGSRYKIDIKKSAMVLKKLMKKYKVLILSNSTKKSVEKKLKELGVNLDFEHRYCFFIRKPLPFTYYKLIRRHKLKAKETVFIGDKIITDLLCAFFVNPKNFFLYSPEKSNKSFKILWLNVKVIKYLDDLKCFL